MKTVGTAPPGFDSWRISASKSMWLPVQVVRQLQDEAQARAVEHREVDVDAGPEHQSTAPAAVEPVIPNMSVESAERYAVMHDFDAIQSGDLWKARRSRSADDDANRRIKDLLDRLVERGPCRRVAQPVEWRAALEELELELPHFAAPIALVKNALALAAQTQRPAAIAPMLLVGPPGVGKTHFAERLASVLQTTRAQIAFDQPSAGTRLRGSDQHWSNSGYGLLFELICLGECANPVIVLDEIDKARVDSLSVAVNPLAQLLGVLEPVTARRLRDISVDIEFDASLVTYVATANSLAWLPKPVVSRFDVFDIRPPEPRDAVATARSVMRAVLAALGLSARMCVDRKVYVVMAHFSARQMRGAAQKAVAAAVAQGRDRVSPGDVWQALGLNEPSKLH